MKSTLLLAGRYLLISTLIILATVSWQPDPAVGSCDYDPLAYAHARRGKVVNREATVPPQCYTKTAGVANPCWTCHVVSQSPNHLDDWTLQKEYAFSDFALNNNWLNLFKDRTAAIQSIPSAEALHYIRQDNYTPLIQALKKIRKRTGFPGYVPDLDFDRGFDDQGFARDGSGWRALRYKPFPGTFWPTNGSTDDVMIRLPREFRQDAAGRPSREIYKINLAILEATIAAPPQEKNDILRREIEPIDETLAGFDVDGDGEIVGLATVLVRLPKHYVGGAAKVKTRRFLMPAFTEFLHTVRYVDPDQPTLMSTRMKEVRYSRKVRDLDHWARLAAFESEIDDKERGRLPVFAGAPEVGLQNEFGWQLQGYIEDAKGRLRLQSKEEHLACMGCHGALGVTVDNTFTLARKVPGAAGWRHQDIRGIPDAPQAGHSTPEIQTWFARVGGGDEFRTNQEILTRFFRNGKLNVAEVARAAKGGDRDITHLIAPSRARSLLLTKTYMVIVREQSFTHGRDPLVGPVTNVHKSIENGSTELGKTDRVFTDGRLWLDW